ncbi:MAG: GNAT family N-acetyltransferase [Mycobacterium leprae]
MRIYDAKADSARVTEILNQWNLVPTSVAEMERGEWRVPVGHYRTVAVADDGRILGFCPTVPDGAGRFFTQVFVDRAHRRQGIGRLLYEDALRFVLANGGRIVQCQVRDDDPDSLAFAERRGFAVDRQQFRSMLSIATCHDDRWQGAVDRAEALGIRFRTLAELGFSAETLRNLYNLTGQVVRDIPGRSLDGPRQSFEEFCEGFRRAALPPECQLVALDGVTWVGVALLSPKMQDGQCLLENDLTGVDRRYRGLGIAQALKVLAVRIARDYGADYIWTRNDSQNAPILAINRKMGYRAEAGVYSLICRVG